MRSLFCIFRYMNRIAFLKTILLLFGTCIALANARQYTIESLNNPRISQQTLAQLNQVQKSIDLSRDTLSEEQWLEVEKNEIVKICIDGQIPVWETSLNAAIYNDSCIVFQAPTLIGIDSLKAFFRKDGGSHKINLAVGMKYLNFKNEKVLLGYNNISKEWETASDDFKNHDPERFVSVTGMYLVDKYPVTNCEFTQQMWDSIPAKSFFYNESIKKAQDDWISRKKRSIRNENCIAHDTAANSVSLYQALKYANARSIRDGLKPYYIFSATKERSESIESNNKYVVKYNDFTDHKDKYVMVSINKNSDGYRLPYYDEWMMFARGGDKKNRAPWGDSTATFEDVLKYAKFSTKFPNTEEAVYYTEHVGQLKPNGYGLYDMFGLVEEHVLLKKILYGNFTYPSCRKGVGYYWALEDNMFGIPRWNKINYGYFYPGHSGVRAGFRLVRNIGNNVKWSEIKTVDNE